MNAKISFSRAAAGISELLIFALVGSWALGLYTRDIARVLLAMSAFAAVLHMLPPLRSRFEPLRGAYLWGAALFVCVIMAEQAANYFLGLQGFDFAIFSQAIESVSRRGGLYSSFVSEGWTHFLSHHFSPILYLPGLLGFVGLSGPASALTAHAVAVSGALCAVYYFARGCGFSSRLSGFLLLLLCLSPTLRVALSWEVRDEVYGLPFVCLAYLAWARGSPRLLMCALIAACLCKESFFVFSLLVGLSLLRWNFENPTLQQSFRRSAFGAIALGILGTYFYILHLDWFTRPTFDPIGRLAPVAALLDPPVLVEKGKFLGLLLVPSLALGLMTRGGLLLSFPALAFVGPILLTDFEAMYHRYNYYGVIPTVILALAGMYSLSSLSPSGERRFPAVGALALVALMLSFASFDRPGRLIARMVSGEWVSPRRFDAIPPDALILADDYTFPYLLDKERVTRFWTASRKAVPWEYIILRRDREPNLPQAFLSRSSPCQEYRSWIVLCPAQR